MFSPVQLKSLASQKLSDLGQEAFLHAMRQQEKAKTPNKVSSSSCGLIWVGQHPRQPLKY